MKLREYIRDSIDTLDDRSLVVIFEQLRMLEERRTISPQNTVIPTLEEVLAATASTPGNWSEDVLAERDERV